MLVRSPVHSATLKRVGYDFEMQTLELTFTSGAVYHYLLVPPDVVNALLNAKSKGEYFNLNIRDEFAQKKIF